MVASVYPSVTLPQTTKGFHHHSLDINRTTKFTPEQEIQNYRLVQIFWSILFLLVLVGRLSLKSDQSK